eukprot:GFUD01006894.1.p1 GENE.GFUD01006894.1~~GFUD01006894.1.p1  ORF type:complete len:377 (-),score=80.58 GFUD01006894.1:15-1145(-)
MRPKRIKIEKDEEVNYEEELVALKTALADKNEEIEALEGNAADDRKKQEETIENLKRKLEESKHIVDQAANERKKQEEAIENLKLMKDNLGVEVNNDKREIKNLKRKLRESENFVGQLKEKIECPVCLEIPQTFPVPVCPNGHLVCNECKGDACPTCRVGMGDAKSLLAVTVIENIDHRCKFVDCEGFFPFDEIEEHAKDCCHRTVSCPQSKCNVKVGLSKLLDHLNDADCSFFPARNEKVSDVKTLRFNMTERQRNKKNLSSYLFTFALEDTSFCIIYEKCDGLYHFYSVMLASEEVCAKYKIYLVVHERDASSDEFEVSFKFCGKPCSIDVDKEEFHGLQIDEKGMKQILSKSRTFGFGVSFSIRKIPVSQPSN